MHIGAVVVALLSSVALSASTETDGAPQPPVIRESFNVFPCPAHPVSTLDLIAYDRLTLVTGQEGRAWERVLPRPGSAPLRFLVEDRDFSDPEGHWASVREIAPSGAVLVRPDQHVAWHTHAMHETAAAQLASGIAAATCSSR